MKTKLFTTAFLICSAFAHTLIAQQFNYEVQRNGKAIGSMQITRVQAGQNIEMSLKFKAEVDLLLKEILVEGSENANFYEGKLQRSSVVRKINGRIKTNIETKWMENRYMVTNAGKYSTLDLKPIETHLLSLYFYEPKNESLIYSDSFPGLLKIEKNQGGYRLVLPNGNENMYTYKNGICIKALFKSAYYTITLQKK
jgi:hypothetical protein